MGVRGLTSYIARHAEIYLKPYELHDCNLVIDGDNLACNLYRDVTGTYSAFGGDYDDFYRGVVQFFQVLAECNVHAYVLMDGGYEPRKLRTVSKRLRGKISVIKRINPCASITLFPLHMKEVFIDAVRDCDVPVMRCIFEADDELAALSRKLNCPVLSYDSDFYIHNVQYIPLITLTVKAHTKVVKDKAELAEKARNLRKNEAKHVEKRTKAHKVMTGGITTDNTDQKCTKKNGKTYKYLDCCIYRIEHLCGRGALSPDKLPLFAALLGNDYIARSAFRNFFAAGMGKAGRSRKLKQQQRRIRNILQWLKEETSESALEKIMSRLKQNQRESLLAQVQAAISGYSQEICHSYDFFSSYYEHTFEKFANIPVDDNVEEANEIAENIESSEEEQSSSDEPDEASNELKETQTVQATEINDIENVEAENDDDEVDEEEEEDEDENEDEENDLVVDKSQYFPTWFLEKLYPAHLSRFFVDLVYLRKYINNPQIEHFPHNECNEIALPILIYIFTLLNNVKDAITPPKVQDADGNDVPLDFTYLTRAVRVTNVCYIHHTIEQTPKYDFVPDNPDVRHLRYIFEQKIKHVDCDLLFEQVQDLPSDLQLYFLAIVYWLQKSQHCDLLHLHALIICLVALRTIDVTIPVERDLRAFHKRFDKIIKKERLVRDKEFTEGHKRTIKPSLLELTVPERMLHVPKSDCYLVQERLLPHFHMQEIFKKKYDLYSTVVLHAYAEFQSVVYQLNALNALLDFPHESPRMGQLYCGVLLYNLYDLLRSRADVKYYVQHYIFSDSQLMYDFYNYLYDWCAPYITSWKQKQSEAIVKVANKKMLKKKRQAARKQAAAVDAPIDPNADMLNDGNGTPEEEEFFDLNNKFCTLKVS